MGTESRFGSPRRWVHIQAPAAPVWLELGALRSSWLGLGLAMGAQGEGGSGADWRGARGAGRQQDESRLRSGEVQGICPTAPPARWGGSATGQGWTLRRTGSSGHRPAGAGALQARRQEALSQPSVLWRRGPKGGAFLKRRRPLQEAKGMAAWAAVDQGTGPRCGGLSWPAPQAGKCFVPRPGDGLCLPTPFLVSLNP